MKTVLCLTFTLLSLLSSRAQNTDLPVPTSNMQSMPAGSYVIAMDNTNQLNNSSVFNLKSYGLVVHLLNNNVKVKWIITAGKVKDATDISVNASRIKPSSSAAAAYNFKAGPFVVFSTDTLGVAALVDGFNSSISNANDKIKVYQTNASVNVDVRYDLTGFVPKAAILTDGGNQNIHIANMTACNITTANYMTAAGPELLVKCFTFASEPHNDKTGQAVNDAITAIKKFVEHGGNFLAQCDAVLTYENSALGRFQTTNGITDAGSNAGTNISYPNADLSFSQFEGNYSISKGGSTQNWRVTLAAGANNFHKHAKGIADTTITGASVSKLASGKGGLVFYIGNHRFDDQLTTLTSINGLRMYMNAFLTPTSLGNCAMGSSYAHPLVVKLTSFQGNLDNKTVKLNWSVADNEIADNFILESSNDGSQFTDDAMVLASNKNGTEQYQYHETLRSEKVYFRLRMTDKSGVVNYSNILAFSYATRSVSTPLVIFGNPIKDKLTFSFRNASNNNVKLKIMDINGHTVVDKIQYASTGINTISLTLPSNLNNGMYFLSLTIGNETRCAKFMRSTN